MKNFEEHLKSSLDKYEAEFNPADWADMESRLNKLNAGKVSSSIGKTILIAASAIAAAGLIYYFSTTNSENNTTEKTIVQNTVVAGNTTNENSVQKEETNSRNSETNNNSPKEKAIVQNPVSENQSTSSGKTETQTENNSSENKVNPEQNQPSEVNSQPSTASVLTATFHTDMNKVCEGAPVQFTADNADANFAYKWFFGDGETSVEQNPQHVFKKAGTFSARLRVTSVLDKKSDEQKNTITVLAAPSVDMTYKASEENNLAVIFDAEAAKTTDWKWDFGDRKIASEQNPSHTYAKYGTYKVAVTAKNSAGCAATLTKEVEVKNIINLFAPNSFSPDGDGLNDTWIPTMSDDYSFVVTVYDKSNTIVFTTTDKNRPWDGVNTKTGDTYSWKAVVKDKNGEESTQRGFVIIK
ncbi:MAG: PKD domain-containing protein [Bacteroidetes bacterium]|nr:PKD domain-containing protein [Bacteroidota bacterium]